jgi:rod shape determining protein RodA
VLSSSYQSSDPFYLKNILRLLSEFDWWLLAATIFLVLISISTLQFAGQGGLYADKQMNYVWAGLVAGLVFWRIPYYFWLNRWVVIGLYVMNIGLLLLVMFVGHAALGAQRWISIGPITLQPSEVAKLIVIFSLAAWMRTHPIRSFFDIIKVAFIILPPALLVFKQPDLGTSLTFGAVFLGMTFWAGASVNDVLVLLSPVISLILNAVNREWWMWFLVVFGVWILIFWRRKHWPILLHLAMVAIVIAANVGCGVIRPHAWGLLKDYQQKRLTSFVNPYDDPRGSGYHILQSLIAIGSGGINGTGLGKGNQTQGAFIPERHTDFIFAVVGEELGFKITALIILAYGVICARALLIAYRSREEPGGSLIAVGIMSMFLFHVFLNIGMTMGIMPVAGVPLPFLSYGGTALIVNLSAVGILHSIRFLNPEPKRDPWQ